MAAQVFIVALLVVSCTTYVAWTLMPAAARRLIAEAALRVPLPRWLAAPFLKATKPASACGGCDNCGDTPAKPALQPVKFHPRTGTRSG
jgi:hypothetical protein